MKSKAFNIILWYSIISIILFLYSCGNKPPKAALENVFENKLFSEPFSVSIPCDEKSEEKNLLKWKEKESNKGLWDGGLPPAHYSVKNNINPEILQLLKSNKLAEIKQQNINTIFGNKDYDFLIYNDNIKKYLVDTSVNCLNGRIGSGLRLNFGKRILTNIDDINELPKEDKEDETNYYIRFTYNIVPNIPGLSVKSNEYKGNMTIYKNSHNEEWIISKIHLEDKDIKEFKY